MLPLSAGPFGQICAAPGIHEKGRGKRKGGESSHIFEGVQDGNKGIEDLKLGSLGERPSAWIKSGGKGGRGKSQEDREWNDHRGPGKGECSAVFFSLVQVRTRKDLSVFILLEKELKGRLVKYRVSWGKRRNHY